jgi:hypothetical protein
MQAVYFLTTKNLPLSLLPSIAQLIRESDSPNLSSSTITYENSVLGNEFLKAISITIEEKI